MKVQFWGVRGSLASPLSNAELKWKTETVLQAAVKAGLNDARQIPEFIEHLPWYIRNTAGGDTTCVEVSAGNTQIILDAGTGIRPLGLDLLRRSAGKPFDAHILLSHTHWDHICGIPFFVPAFNPANNIVFYGVHDRLKERISHQQDFDYFPVPLKIMSGIRKFVQLEEGTSFVIGKAEVETMPLNHPGGCTGFRIIHDGKTIIYATDSEYKETGSKASKPFVNFFRGADLMIFDAQYTLLENIEKEDWGHSNAFAGIDMAIEAGVKRLAFTHHEPSYRDDKIWDIFKQAEEYLKLHPEGKNLELILAQEGMSIKL